MAEQAVSGEVAGPPSTALSSYPAAAAVSEGAAERRAQAPQFFTTLAQGVISAAMPTKTTVAEAVHWAAPFSTGPARSSYATVLSSIIS
jgi:hypothetical protein